jgi:hypothetical protein
LDLVLRRRQCVYRGLSAAFPTVDDEEKQLFADWTGKAQPLAELESRLGVIEGAHEIALRAVPANGA